MATLIKGSPEAKQADKEYAEYLIDFHNSKVADDPNNWANVSRLAKAYDKAAKSGLFSESQTKLFTNQAKQYGDQVPSLKAAAQQASALESSADTIRRTIYDQAVANRDTLFNAAVERRDTLRNAADSFLNTSLEQISKDVADGKLNVNQANALRNQAREQHTNARSVAESNFNVERAAATEAFDQGKTYSTEIQQGIMSGQVDPSGQFKAPTPQVGGLAAIPTFQNLNYEAVRDIAAPVVEPRTGPIQRVEPEKIVAQKPEIGDIVGDMMREMEAQEAEIAQPIAPREIPFVAAGKTGLTDEQARNIAEQLLIYSNADFDNLDEAINYIKSYGPEAAIDLMAEQGAFVGSLKEGFVPRDVAADAVDYMYAQYGMPLNSSYRNDWIKYTQQNGIAEGAKLFAERQAKFIKDDAPAKAKGFSLIDAVNQQFSPEAVEASRTAYIQEQRNKLDSSIDKILAGQDLTPAVDFEGPPEKFVDALFRGAKIAPNPNDSFYQQMVGFVNKYGPDAATAEFNQSFRNFYGERAVEPILNYGSGFDPRNVYGQQPAFPGAPTSGQQPAFPGAPTYAPPLTQPPAAGLPAALPAALPGPRSFVTETERPMLTPQTQYIGAPSVDRGVREPMQPFVPSQFGLNTLTPLQYLEAARAAGLPVSANAPVEPFATPVGSDVPVEGLKEGGLASVAKTLESKGRKGDTMLVHMTPDEVAGLQNLAVQMGGSLTINPETGLPEANFFKRVGRGLKKLARNPIVRVGIAALAAPYLPAIAGSTAITAGLLTGAGTMLGGGNFQQGLQSGLLAYGGARLSSGAMGSNPLGVGGESTFNLANTFGPSTGAISSEAGGVTADELLAGSGRGMTQAPIEQMANIPAGGETVAQMGASKAGEGTILGMKPSTALVGGMLASSLYTGEQERDMYQKQYDDYIADVEARKRRGMESFNRSSMPTYAARGGLMSLAGGGITYAEGGGTTGPTNEPRMVQGTGDGMSDSVPATIEGVQEARLANDEFVIPADVVADLGNGSSNAGAKQLYAMMDRIRKARHGTTEQPPEINAMKLMPA